MAKLDEQRSSSRAKAEELLSRRKQQETERLDKRKIDSRAQDEKIARLRGLRLAKESAEKNAPKPEVRPAVKKAIKTA